MEWFLKFIFQNLKQNNPQLEPKPHTADPQGLNNSRPARTEPATQNLLGHNPFSLTSGSSTVTVTEISHGRATSNVVRFRNVVGSPGGLAYTVFENSSGFAITKVNNDSYTFNCGSNATLTETGGGTTVTAGPVTQES